MKRHDPFAIWPDAALMRLLERTPPLCADALPAECDNSGGFCSSIPDYWWIEYSGWLVDARGHAIVGVYADCNVCRSSP